MEFLTHNRDLKRHILIDKKKIHIFCDNARYYKNRAVRAYLEDLKVELQYTDYPDFEDFKLAVLGFLRTLSTRDSLGARGGEQKPTNSLESVVSALYRDWKLHREEFLNFKR